MSGAEQCCGCDHNICCAHNRDCRFDSFNQAIAIERHANDFHKKIAIAMKVPLKYIEPQEQFSEVTIKPGIYHTADELNGKELENGEWVEIKFHDGTLKFAKIIIQAYTESVYERGGDTPTTHSCSYVEIIIHGTKALIGLRGTGLLIRRTII